MARPLPPAVRRRWEHDATLRRPRKPAAHSAAQPATPRSVGERRIPDMAFLYITEQGAVLRKSGDRFLVEKDDQVLLDLPYHKLEHVVLFGNIQVTAQAMGELLDKGVKLSLFSRHGVYRGALSSPRGGDIALRLAQFRMHEDGTRVMDTARAFVQAKISNGLDFLAAYRKSYGAEAEWDEERERFAAAIQEATGAVTLQSLEGVEGAAARRYFELLMRFNRSPFKWQGRIRHPSPDPLNGLLSLTYTLVGHELAALCEAAGLDPYLGCLHQPDYGRASLAQDLLEPFRHPLADRFVMALVNRSQFQPEDFRQDPNGGCFLGAEALKRYFMEYEKWMLAPRFDDGKPWRRILQAEVERFAQAVKTASQFHPFTTATLKGPGELNPEEICATSSVTI
jgi:CRISPR-associated protein Cas1